MQYYKHCFLYIYIIYYTVIKSIIVDFPIGQVQQRLKHMMVKSLIFNGHVGDQVGLYHYSGYTDAASAVTKPFSHQSKQLQLKISNKL